MSGADDLREDLETVFESDAGNVDAIPQAADELLHLEGVTAVVDRNGSVDDTVVAKRRSVVLVVAVRDFAGWFFLVNYVVRVLDFLPTFTTERSFVGNPRLPHSTGIRVGD